MEKEVIIKSTALKYSGTFDLMLLYRNLQGWIKRKGYSDVKESRYVEKVKPNGKFVEVTWSTFKEESAYLRLDMEIKFFVIGMNDVEVDYEGKKIKLNKGDLELYFSATLVKNANDDWPDNSFKKKFYERYIISEKIEEHKINLYKDAMGIIDEAKKFLNIYRA